MAHPIADEYSNAYALRALAFRKLERSLSNCGALPVSVIRLLIDEYLLLETLNKTNILGKLEYVDLYDNHSEFDEKEATSKMIYNDYSFVIAPAYKAFEGFLLFIAKSFNLPVEKYEHNIGGLYDWEANKNEGDEILKALEGKLGNDKEGKDRWRELNMVLRTYRHNPAHYSGDKIETFEQAEDYVKTIINTINQMTNFVIKKGVIGSGSIELDEICTVKGI